MASSSTARFDSPHPASRLVPFAAVLAFACGATVLAVRDARARRERRQEDARVRVDAAQLTGPEIALHSASRWLRHPTRSEPWAASADGPAMLDLDPAGALAPPPVAVVRAGMPASRFVLTRRPR
jgi:hypothetical protein